MWNIILDGIFELYLWDLVDNCVIFYEFQYLHFFSRMIYFEFDLSHMITWSRDHVTIECDVTGSTSFRVSLHGMMAVVLDVNECRFAFRMLFLVRNEFFV